MRRGGWRRSHKATAPLLDPTNTSALGNDNFEAIDAFLGNAYALLCPIDWPEPFGITMVEAMACGTPVIAMEHGSVPEIVAHGETGFVCRSIAEMIAAVDEVPRIDPRTCRTRVAERFSVERMADGYEAVYRHALAGVLAETAAPRARKQPDAYLCPAVQGPHHERRKSSVSVRMARSRRITSSPPPS